MVASDIRILELIVSKQLEIWPFIYSNIQPASIDLTLDSNIKLPPKGTRVDPEKGVNDDEYEVISLANGDYDIQPHSLILAQTHEKIRVPENYCCSVTNRASVARLGLDVSLVGYMNPGYAGQLPIVISNQGDFSIRLYPGLRICQFVLSKTDPTPLRDYSKRHDVKYMNEKDSLVSKLHLDEELRACAEKVGAKKTETSEFVKELSSYWDDLATHDYEEFMKKMDDKMKEELGLL